MLPEFCCSFKIPTLGNEEFSEKIFLSSRAQKHLVVTLCDFLFTHWLTFFDISRLVVCYIPEYEIFFAKIYPIRACLMKPLSPSSCASAIILSTNGLRLVIFIIVSLSHIFYVFH